MNQIHLEFKCWLRIHRLCNLGSWSISEPGCVRFLCLCNKLGGIKQLEFILRTLVVGSRAQSNCRMISSQDPLLITSAETFFFQIRSHCEVPGRREIWGTPFSPPHLVSSNTKEEPSTLLWEVRGWNGEETPALWAPGQPAPGPASSLPSFPCCPGLVGANQARAGPQGREKEARPAVS